jgi:hypothetical protein
MRLGVAATWSDATAYYDSKRVKPGKKGLTVPTQIRCVVIDGGRS